jgi:hypothetical protein
MAGYKKIYDIGKVQVNVGAAANAIPLEGINSVSVERNNDEYTTYVAADGSYRTVRNNDRSGQIRVTAANLSPSHTALTVLHKSGVAFPIAVVDPAGTLSFCFGDGCMLMRPAPWNRGPEDGETEYIFTCGDLEISHGGAADA